MGLAVIGLLCLGVTACKSPHQPTCRTEASSRREEPGNRPGWPKADFPFQQVSYQEARAALPVVANAEYVNDDELCATCHPAYAAAFANNVHRRDSCESCHGPASRHVETRGKEPGLIFSFKTGDPIVRAEACLKCHEENQCTEGAQWRTSKHAHCGVTCVDCHRGHYEIPAGTPATVEPTTSTNSGSGLVELTNISFNKDDGPAKNAAKAALPSLKGTSSHLGAVAPYSCYRCHCDKQDMQQIAGPHQICGPNGFNCTTCHEPHGVLRESSRKDLCLSCHKGTPTMAWHSSIHEINGVACTDCHNPHPNGHVQKIVNISHTHIDQNKRLPMSVQEPEACYKCHPKIFALNSLPSRHPIKDGKMVCSDCHDPHGQREGNLKGETINLVCYRCHMEKQGPFAYPHAPVTENCAICHEPHGTVADNLLRQPTTFLCLRCHTGHRVSNAYAGYPGASSNHGNRVNIDAQPQVREAVYTNCTACHKQIHGSDVPSPTLPNPQALFR